MERVAAVETLYTYEAAVKRYERERHHEWLCRQKRLQEIREEQRDRRKYFCEQRFYGSLLTIICLMMFCFTKDGMCLLFTIGGIYITISKKMLLVNDYFYKHHGEENG